MLRVIRGGPPRPTQADLENVLVWRNRINDFQRHLDRVAPRILEAVQQAGPDVVEPGPNVALVEPVVEIGGVRYRTLRINHAPCYCLVEGELHSIEQAVCRIRGV